jgi:ribosomal-protein-serine acetyltransferase
VSEIPAPLFSHSLGEDAALVPKMPEIADAYHELFSRNQERIARWESWASQESSPGGMRDYLVHLGQGWINGEGLPGAIACKTGDRWVLVGSVGLTVSSYTSSAEIGFWIDASYEGRGLVTRAARVLIEYAFDRLKLARVSLQTVERNERSIAVARRLGFTQEGHLRAAANFPDGPRDVLVFGLTAADWQKPGASQSR